jgi:hypothetical protein
MPKKTANVRYSEADAAERLGITVDQLRALIKRHISNDDDLPARPTFQPADLIMLSVLAGKPCCVG